MIIIIIKSKREICLIMKEIMMMVTMIKVIIVFVLMNKLIWLEKSQLIILLKIWNLKVSNTSHLKPVYEN